MARKHVHEEHLNHEAWAIPYGDLITLLLAFFVVMYAISSVNEGKYRQVADSLNSAFGGTPKSGSPIQLRRDGSAGPSSVRPALAPGASVPMPASAVDVPRLRPDANGAKAAQAATRRQLQGLGDRIGDALAGLVKARLVRLRQGADYLEVEIQSDLLFPSGSALPSAIAVDTVQKIAGVMRDAPNAIRVEGYTDDQPIGNAQFPSNWELSAARAASVLHVLADAGVAPSRLSMTGYAQYQPVADNATPDGRNANRRVMLVILPPQQGPDSVTRAMPVAAAQPAGANGTG